MSDILGIQHPKIDKRSEISKHAWLKDNLAILPIRKLERTPYKGEVLSIAVENNANYVTKGFVVHNCDAPLFKNKTVAVIGGSDSAVKDALILAEYAKKVYILYRGDKVRAEPITLERAEKNEKIEIVNKVNVTEIKGDNIVRKLSLDKEFKGSKELDVQGVFVAIGHVPLTDLAKKLGVELNEKGEIIINHKTAETNLKGVYAAGDVTDKAFKQAIIGVAEGCTAAYSAYEYLKKK
jgi:thioredoxin reductase (NADPH)